MGIPLDDNLKLVDLASRNNYDRLFTSLHIPEADYTTIIKEFKCLVKFAKERGFIVIADISSIGFELLNNKERDLNRLKESGVDVLRLDFGFFLEEISDMTHNKEGIRIELNVSTFTEKTLKEFDKYNPDYSNITACHNYYPRKNTGISIEKFIDKNKKLKDRGVEISSFISSLKGRRGLIYEGLPTIEKHRDINPYISARELFLLGSDNVLFGDSMPSEDEIISVGSINEKIVELRVEKFYEGVIENRYFNNIFTNRDDGAEDAIRAVEGRNIINKGEIIKCNNCIKRKIGMITVDNERYKRYMGELQIIKKELEEDTRVNVIGKIVEEDMMLLKYIDDGRKFRLL